MPNWRRRALTAPEAANSGQEKEIVTIWQPLPNQPSPPETGVYGFGDMVPTFFLSPKKPGKGGLLPRFVAVKNETHSRAVLEMGISPLFRVPACLRTRGSISTGN